MREMQVSNSRDGDRQFCGIGSLDDGEGNRLRSKSHLV
jgi:hypothetical protein